MRPRQPGVLFYKEGKSVMAKAFEIKPLIRKAFNDFLEILFPGNIYCICCGRIIDDTRPYALCDHCVRAFHWATGKTCLKCGKIMDVNSRRSLCRDCSELSHRYEQGFTCVQYGLYERSVMLSFKYGDQAYIGEKLGDILFDRISPELESGLAFDCIIPVPMHKRKVRKRGYNQAELMARPLAHKTGVPLLKDALVRIRESKPMSKLSTFDRMENVKNIFTLREDAVKLIRSKTVLLIDDIYTTGSTADECSKVLLEAGAEKVYLLTFAAGAN